MTTKKIATNRVLTVSWSLKRIMEILKTEKFTLIVNFFLIVSMKRYHQQPKRQKNQLSGKKNANRHFFLNRTG